MFFARSPSFGNNYTLLCILTTLISVSGTPILTVRVFATNSMPLPITYRFILYHFILCSYQNIAICVFVMFHRSYFHYYTHAASPCVLVTSMRPVVGICSAFSNQSRVAMHSFSLYAIIVHNFSRKLISFDIILGLNYYREGEVR